MVVVRLYFIIILHEKVLPRSIKARVGTSHPWTVCVSDEVICTSTLQRKYPKYLTTISFFSLLLLLFTASSSSFSFVVVVFVRRRRRLHDFTLLEKSDLFGRSTKKTKFKKFGKIYFTMLGREQVEEGLHLKPEASSSNPIIGNLKTNVA